MLWLIFLIVFVAFLYEIGLRPFKYWLERGVPHEKPWPVVGNMADVTFKKVSMSEKIQNLYLEYPNRRYNGFFQFYTPSLLIRDLDLIKQLTIRDFDYFQDHRTFITEEDEPIFGKNLFALKDQRWRDMRAILSPAFTSAKMRSMFILIADCADKFTTHFQHFSKNTTAVEVKDVFTRYTNDIIATAAFGVKCDSLTQKHNDFYTMGKKATTFTGFRAFKMFMFSMFPSLMRLLGVHLFSKSLEKFFNRLVKDSIEYREREGLIRPDMIHLLMEARKGKLKHDVTANGIEDTGFATVEESKIGLVNKQQTPELTDEDIMAQAFVFFFAGFDTSSTLMSFMSYELALNCGIQKRLQQEIDQTFANCPNGVLTYDALLGMKYMDMVVSETLRKWPPAIATDRMCRKSYKLQPNKEEEIEFEEPLTIENGTCIFIPIYGIHRDEKYFPNPEKFDPERFSEENKSKIVPNSFIPFGVGPRNCIGSRFALMETKTLFCYLLSKCDIVLIEKTQVPVKLTKGTFNVTPEKGIWLGLKPRKV